MRTEFTDGMRVPSCLPRRWLHRFATLILAILPGLLATGPASSAESSEARRAPNIVLLLADDLGWTDLGCCGSRYYETPNIDRLAAQGMRFTDAYTNGPNCAPTRACLMSGKYTPRHGIFTVGDPVRGPLATRRLIPAANNTTLPLAEITVAEALRRGGYTSAAIGKWHLGGPGHLPEDQGFDLNVGGSASGSPAGGYFLPNKMNLPRAAQGEYLTDHLTDRALEFIEANRGRPFFLYMAYHSVHTPIQAKKEDVARYRDKEPSGGHNNAVYAAMIHSLDENVGRILGKLDELGLSGRTVVLFLSDNGGVGGYRAAGVPAGDITSNAPLRGGKGMLYEGGVRVPWIVRWPGVVRAGSLCREPVITIDLYPTLLEMAALPGDPRQKLDGRSIVSLLKEEGGVDREALYWHFPAYLQASGKACRTTPAGAVREGEFKLLEFFEDGRLELYNLKTDIGERTNLAAAMPEKAQQLHRLLEVWRKNVNAPMPKPNPDYDESRAAKRERRKR